MFESASERASPTLKGKDSRKVPVQPESIDTTKTPATIFLHQPHTSRQTRQSVVVLCLRCVMATFAWRKPKGLNGNGLALGRTACLKLHLHEFVSAIATRVKRAAKKKCFDESLT